MNRYWKGAIAFLAAFLLQPFLFSLVPGLGIVPDLILCLTAALTYVYDDNVGWMAMGAGFALATDIVSGPFIGIGMLSIIAVEVGILVFKKFFNVENLVNSAVLAILVTWVYQTVYWIIAAIAGSNYGYLYAMKTIIWQILFDAVIFMIIYFIMIRKVTPHRTDRYFG